MNTMLRGKGKRTGWRFQSLLLAAALLLSACGAGTESIGTESAGTESGGDNSSATAADQGRTVVFRTSGPRQGADEMLQGGDMKKVWYTGDHEGIEEPSESGMEDPAAHYHIEQIPVYLLIDENGEVLHQERGYDAAIGLLGRDYAYVRPSETAARESQEGGSPGGKVLTRDGTVVAEGVTWAYLAGTRGAHTFLALGREEGADLVRLTEGEEPQQLYHFDYAMENRDFEGNDDFFAYLASDGALLIFDLASLEMATEPGEPVWRGGEVSQFYWAAKETLPEGERRYTGALTDAAGRHTLQAGVKASQRELHLTSLPEEVNAGYDAWAAVKVGEYWGYVGADGQEVIAPRFYEARPFYGDVAVVAEIGQMTPEGGGEPIQYYYYTAIDREGQDITKGNGREGMAFDSVLGDQEENHYVILPDGEVKPLALSEENLTVNGKVCEVAGVLPEYLAESTLCPVSLTEELGGGVYHTGLYDFAAETWAVPPEEGGHFQLVGPMFLAEDGGGNFQGEMTENLFASIQQEDFRFYDMEGVEVAPEDPRLANLAIYVVGEEEWGLYWADGSPLYAEEAPKAEEDEGAVTGP